MSLTDLKDLTVELEDSSIGASPQNSIKQWSLKPFEDITRDAQPGLWGFFWQGSIPDRKTLIRVVCHILIERIPDQGIPELCETLNDIYKSYSSLLEQESLLLSQPQQIQASHGAEVERSKVSVIEAIDLALAEGDHTKAVNLVAKGQTLFPEDVELQKIAKILAPPKVTRLDIPPAEGLGLSMKWLKENRQDYQGKWVAVRNGVLLGYASSRADLSAMLDEADSSKVIITRIPESLS